MLSSLSCPALLELFLYLRLIVAAEQRRPNASFDLGPGRVGSNHR